MMEVAFPSALLSMDAHIIHEQSLMIEVAFLNSEKQLCDIFAIGSLSLFHCQMSKLSAKQ